ncbi:zinc-binding dehydrogenase [Vulcanisaeta distributa]|uniref:zinc-binding dehydrogenase n=1 Tax=Vulcanisaeta distributa TaxID=164451 RepID=UPI000A77CEFC|nr:zinc-binding dehydrogenase [Vulcanisaeta distributa]
MVIGNVNPDESYPLRLGYLILKDVVVIGNVRSNRSDVAETLRILSRGGLVRPIVAATYPLDKFSDALDFMRNNSRIGKVLIKP